MGRGRRNQGARAAPQAGAVLCSQSDHRAIWVQPGLLDARAVVAFGAGQCHALALALHDSAALELAAYEDEEGDAVHVFVVCADGRALDAGGALPLDEHQELWAGDYLECSRARVASLHLGGSWREPDLELARTFVEPVLSQLGSSEGYRHPDDFALETVLEPEMRVVGRERDYRLRPGVLDDEARAAFRDGQAHALALALHLACGRDDAGLLVLRREGEDPSRAFLALADGRLLDVDGVHRREEVERLGELEPVRYREIRQIEDWPSPDLAAAETFVGPLLALLG